MIIMSSPIAHNTESYYLDQNIAPARHPESVKNLYKKPQILWMSSTMSRMSKKLRNNKTKG